MRSGVITVNEKRKKMDSETKETEKPNEVSIALQPQRYSLNLTEQVRTLNEEWSKFENLSKNPFALASMITALNESMARSNRLVYDINNTLKDLSNRIENLEKRISEQGKSTQAVKTTMSERDQEIYDYIMTVEKTCAEELAQKFNYKGKHAASARLSKLFEKGLLEKTHAGRKVFYSIKP